MVRDRSAVGGGRACGKSTGDPDEDGPSSLYNIYNVCVMILIAHAILCIILFLMQEGGRYSWVPLVEKQSQLPPGRYINMWEMLGSAAIQE